MVLGRNRPRARGSCFNEFSDASINPGLNGLRDSGKGRGVFVDTIDVNGAGKKCEPANSMS
jgi:hypothetical protein